MHKRSQRLKRREPAAVSRATNVTKFPAAAQEVFGFGAAFLKLFAGAGLPVLPKCRGCRVRVPLGNLLAAIGAM